MATIKMIKETKELEEETGYYIEVDGKYISGSYSTNLETAEEKYDRIRKALVGVTKEVVKWEHIDFTPPTKPD